MKLEDELDYETTRRAAARFELGLAHAHEPGTDMQADHRHILIEAMESQLRDLRQDLAEYEWRNAVGVREVELFSLAELPPLLVQVREGAGLTPGQLAERLGVSEEQVLRQEASGYSDATLAEIQAVAEALGVKVRERVLIPASDRDEPAPMSAVAGGS